MSALFTMDEALAALDGSAVGVGAADITGVSIDSRSIGPGELFFAIAGDRFDGHDFVPTALAAGAAAAVVAAGRETGAPSGLIVVDDPLAALRRLAAAARNRSAAAIVAVTGSVGKTTTKEAIRTVCQTAGPTHAAVRSFNNHWGVPLTLARLPREARFGIFEIGMNHAGEIAPLARLVRPQIAVVTAVAPAHLAAFASVADIARAKAEIFQGLQPGGTALINADHEHLDILLAAAETAGARIVTYGFAPDAEWRLMDAADSDEGASGEIAHGDERLTLRLAVRGRHMLANALAALIVGRLLDVPTTDALAALARFRAPEGRGEVLPFGPAERPLLVIDESYNANTASMRAALDVFAGVTPPAGRKVLVLGDMLELGAAAPEHHRALAPSVLASGADRIFLVGPEMAALAEALGPERVTAHAHRADDLAGPILNALAYGDAIMVKGSNGVRLAGLIDKIRARFS